jgi:hypothetical protein
MIISVAQYQRGSDASETSFDCHRAIAPRPRLRRDGSWPTLIPVHSTESCGFERCSADSVV